MAVLAIAYSSGMGNGILTNIAPDSSQFMFWVERAAQNGSAVGKRLYGDHLADLGRMDEAKASWREAGEAGDIFALYRWSSRVLQEDQQDLDQFYGTVRTVLEQHPASAAVWLKDHLSGLEKAASQHVELSIRHLAYIDSVGLRDALRELPKGDVNMGRMLFPIY